MAPNTINKEECAADQFITEEGRTEEGYAKTLPKGTGDDSPSTQDGVESPQKAIEGAGVEVDEFAIIILRKSHF